MREGVLQVSLWFALDNSYGGVKLLVSMHFNVEYKIMQKDQDWSR